MSDKKYLNFVYAEKSDYDKTLKVNGDTVGTYSDEKLGELYPDRNYAVVGETFEKKKRDKNKDIGRIELADKRLYVVENGTHNKIFRKQDRFVALQDGGFIAVLRLRLLPIILLACLALGGIVAGILAFLPQRPDVVDPNAQDPNIRPVQVDMVTIVGTVYKGGQPLEGAVLSVQKGNTEVAKATTDAAGNYLISDVRNGDYNLVCSYGESVLTKMAAVNGTSVTVNFYFPANDLHDIGDIINDPVRQDLPVVVETDDASEVKAIVKIADDQTPAVAVSGLTKEALLHMIAGKEVDITFIAAKLVPEEIELGIRNAIEAIAGELRLTYYDFTVKKEILKDGKVESSELLTKTKTVLEIAVPYDSSQDLGTYVFRYHDGAARFEALSARPDAADYRDGTYYVTADTVYIYSDCFSVFAIGSVSTGVVTKGSDTITYSDKAVVNRKTGEIQMLYRHDADATNAARVELYLVGTNGNLLIAQSGRIPAGNELTKMVLSQESNSMPSIGTYAGLMRVIYLDAEGQTATNVEIPLSVAITQ